jgi:hypothetical protein
LAGRRRTNRQQPVVDHVTTGRRAVIHSVSRGATPSVRPPPTPHIFSCSTIIVSCYFLHAYSAQRGQRENRVLHSDKNSKLKTSVLTKTVRAQCKVLHGPAFFGICVFLN